MIHSFFFNKKNQQNKKKKNQQNKTKQKSQNEQFGANVSLGFTSLDPFLYFVITGFIELFVKKKDFGNILLLF